MNKSIILFIILISFSFAQTSFPNSHLGVWEGKMKILKEGKVKVKIDIKMTIKETENDSLWIWKTEYISDKMPGVKDYKLKLINRDKGLFIIDEGDGLELDCLYFENKLYSIFSFKETLLTATYEFKEDEIIFEVLSGKKGKEVYPNVSNYPLNGFQKFKLKKVKDN